MTSPDTLLETIFIERYVPERLQNTSIRTRRNYETAFRWMKRYLGRAPTLADLRHEIVDATAEQNLARGARPRLYQ